MKKKLLPLALAAAAGFTGIWSQSGHADFDILWRQSHEYFPDNNILVQHRDRVDASEHIPLKLQFPVRHLGEDATSVHHTDDISLLTGVNVKGDKTLYQRSNSEVSPCNVVQVQGNRFGVYVNSENCVDENTSGGGQNIAMQYIWPINDPNVHKPWSTPGDNFVLQGNQKIPIHNRVASGRTAVTQVNWVVGVSDPDGNLAQILINSFDSDFSSYSEFIAHDTYTIFTSTHFLTKNGKQADNISISKKTPLIKFHTSESAASPRYITRSVFSSVSQNTAYSDPKFYRFHITRDNLENIKADSNGVLTGDVSEWALQGIYWFVEVANTSSSHKIEIGASMEDLIALTCSGADENGNLIC